MYLSIKFMYLFMHIYIYLCVYVCIFSQSMPNIWREA